MVQIIEGSGQNPEIIIDADNAFIALRGVCVPEAGSRLFNPIMSLVEEIMHQRNSIYMTFELKYFNSVSSQYLLKLFAKIAMRLSGDDIRIEWRFDPEDEDNRMKGELFAELAGLKFEFIESKINR